MPDLIQLEPDPPEQTAGTAPVPETPASDDADLEQHAVDVPASALQPKPEKMVKLSAMKEEREARRHAERTARETTDKLRALEQQLSSIAPLIQTIQQRPDIQALLQGQAPEHPAPPKDDTEAREYAEALGIYTAAGEVDVTRGRKALDIANRIAGRTVDSKIAPVQQMTTAQQAGMIRQQLYAAVKPDGSALASRESLDQALAMIPADVLTQQGVAQWVMTTAVGMDALAGRVPKPKPEGVEPLYTEAPGGRMVRRGPEPISALERIAMERTGVDEKTWNKLTSGLSIQPGQTIPLE